MIAGDLSGLYCPHDHLAGYCESCVLRWNMERGRIPVAQPESPGLRAAVTEHTTIERADLGDGITTFVAAGDLVPLGLEDLPRQAAPARGGGVSGLGPATRRSRSGRQPAPPPPMSTS